MRRQGSIRGAALATAIACVMAGLRAAPVVAAPDEHGALRDASVRSAEAQRHLAAGDHDAAVTALEEGLRNIPDGPGYAPTRARMLLLVIAAHEVGFAVDGDLGRLHQARRLLNHYLGPLDLLDEQGRGEAEERRSQLIDQIAEIEAARRRLDDLRAAAERRARAERARGQARTLTVAGIVTTSLGVAGLAMMGAGLGVGSSADARIDGLAEQYGGDPCVPGSAACEGRYQAFQEQRRRGNAGNIVFVAGAASGGALLATGLTLLLVARKRSGEARALQIAPTPTVLRGGLGLTLTGSF